MRTYLIQQSSAEHSENEWKESVRCLAGAESLGFQGVWRARIWREKQKRLGREEKVVTSASTVGCHF